MDNAAWTKTGVTISANASVSPDGYTSSDKIVGAASAGDKFAFQSLTITAGQSFTISAFFKKSEYKLAFIRAGGQTGQPYVIYDLDTEAVVSTSGASSTKIEDYGNGWYRVSLTLNSASGTSVATVVSFLPNTGYTLSALNVPSYTGDATSGGFVWGCQLEANGAAYATSYIPTLGAAITRVADAASKTGISSLIGQTEGTIYWEGQISSTTGFPQLCDLNADGNKYIQIYNSLLSGTPRIGLYIQNVSVLLNVSNIATISFDTNFKFALAYKNNDYAAYLNGNLVYTNTTIGVPPTSNFGIAAVEQTVETAGKKVDQTLLFKTRLTNAQLAELTA
jgi:hypothetical protein